MTDALGSSAPFCKTSVFTAKIFVTSAYSNTAKVSPTPVFKNYSGTKTALADLNEDKIKIHLPQLFRQTAHLKNTFEVVPKVASNSDNINLL